MRWGPSEQTRQSPSLRKGSLQRADSGPGSAAGLGQLLLPKVPGQMSEARDGFLEEERHELASEGRRGVSQLER